MLTSRLAFRLLHWQGRLLVWLAAGLTVVLLAGAAWLQWWVYPRLDSFRPELAARLASAVGRPVEIGGLRGGWQGARPYLAARDVVLKDETGRPALTLGEIEAELSWWPLLIGDFRFDRITAIRPVLTLTRETDGTLALAGLPLNRGGADNRLADWLLRQHELAIREGQLRWEDKARGAPPLALAQVNFLLQNQLFGQHLVRLTATPPPTLSRSVYFVGRWRGDALEDWSNWAGELQVRLAGVDLAAWSRWLPYPIEVQQGRGLLDATVRFDAAQITAVSGRADLQGARLRLARDLAPITLDRLAGHGDWSRHTRQRSLRLSGLNVQANGGYLFERGEVELVLRAQGEHTLRVTGLRLPALANLPAALPLPQRLHRILAGVRPSGELTLVGARWQGDWREPIRLAGEVSFRELGLIVPTPGPTLGLLDGELRFEDERGTLALRSPALRVDLPGVFERALALGRTDARFDWRREGKVWTVNLRDFSLRHPDIEARANATWTWPGEGLGHLRLAASIPRVAAPRVVDFLPLQVGPDTRAWLKNALIRGEAHDARFTLDGPLAAFPFANGRSGRWEVEAFTRGVTLDYAPGWPRIDQIEGRLHFLGDSMTLDATGRYGDTRIDRVRASIPALSAAHAVRIEGEASGPTSGFFRFLNNSPLNLALGGLTREAQAQGDGRLQLDLTVPFEADAPTQVRGRYRFRNNRVRLSNGIPWLERLSGELGFSEQGADARGITAVALGGATRLDIDTLQGGSVRIRANGRADLRQVAVFYNLPFAESISGSSDYRLEIAAPGSGGWQLALLAPLRNARLDLPAPFYRPAGDPGTLQLGVEAGTGRERWRVALAHQLSAEFLRQSGPAGWRTVRGELHLGPGSPSLPREGIWLTGYATEVDLDAWLMRLDGRGKAATARSAATLDGVDARAGKLYWAGKRFDDVSAVWTPRTSGWQLAFGSLQASGLVSWSDADRGRVVARLGRLAMPLTAREGIATREGSEFERLPALDVVVEDFLYKNRSLGRLELQAKPQHEIWQIDRLAISNPDGRLDAVGAWRQTGGQSTTLQLGIRSDNVGRLLDRFGYSETVRRGSAELKGQLSWQGPPMSPDYPSLSGDLQLRAENGQFAKVEPGVGRLLGVLSLQALPRRMTLDFRDIFSEGFAFDRFEGNSQISRGVLRTRNLQLVGPAASISFSGEADITTETQNLRVRIVPTVGDSVAVGAGVALANPVVGLGAFLLQRVLKDPLGQIVAYEYRITGKWDDPKVERASETVANPAKTD